MNNVLEAVHSAFLQSPVGVLKICTTESHVTHVSFYSNDMGQHFPFPQEGPQVLQQCINELSDYFSGKRQNFEVPLLPAGTPFQQQVWRDLLEIGFGRQRSYAQQAHKLGNIKAIRALASANGKNPVAIIIPCHRVVGSDGSLVGFGGGLWRKKWLLEHEAKLSNGVLTLF